MAKLLLVLFLAGCYLNISHSRLIPPSSDLDSMDADYHTISGDDKVPEVNPEYDSNSVTEFFDKPKIVVKRQEANNATSNNATTNQESPSGSPSNSTMATGGQKPPAGPLPTNCTTAPVAAGSDFETSVNIVVNITDSVSQIMKQLGDFNELIFGIFETFGRFERAALDIEEPSENDDLISDGSFNFFGQLGGNRQNDDAELVPSNELEQSKKDVKMADEPFSPILPAISSATNPPALVDSTTKRDAIDEPLEDILPTNEELEVFLKQLEASVADLLKEIEAYLEPMRTY